MDPDCWRHVLNFVDVESLASVALTCKQFAVIVMSRSFLLGLFHREGLASFLEDEKACKLTSFMREAMHDNVDLADERARFRYLRRWLSLRFARSVWLTLCYSLKLLASQRKFGKSKKKKFFVHSMVLQIQRT
jgi:hypothetical protein